MIVCVCVCECECEFECEFECEGEGEGKGEGEGECVCVCVCVCMYVEYTLSKKKDREEISSIMDWITSPLMETRVRRRVLNTSGGWALIGFPKRPRPSV